MKQKHLPRCWFSLGLHVTEGPCHDFLRRSEDQYDLSLRSAGYGTISCQKGENIQDAAYTYKTRDGSGPLTPNALKAPHLLFLLSVLALAHLLSQHPLIFRGCSAHPR